VTADTPDELKTGGKNPLWLILFGLAPALWLLACGLCIELFMDPVHIHPESPDYPHWRINLMLGGMVVIAITFAFVVLRKVEMHGLLRIPAILFVAAITHFANIMVGMAGCGVVGGLASLVK